MIKKSGFTMLEIVVVLIITSVIIAFAVPNFKTQRERAIERASIMNLQVMQEAIKFWLQKTGSAEIDNWGSLALINSNLGIYMADADGVLYVCGGNILGAINTCSAAFSPSIVDADGWSILFSDSNVTIHCKTGDTCPTCLVSGCTY